MDIYQIFKILTTPQLFWQAFLAFLSILPWSYALYSLQPEGRKFISALFGLMGGLLSTYVILYLSDILWPEVNITTPRSQGSILTQTLHFAFIQASMMEESFKILFILFFSFLLAWNWRNRIWQKNVILIAGFVALGFSLRENYIYFDRNGSQNLLKLFIGRTIHSSNIHLLINLCFALFLLKSNQRYGREAFFYILLGFVIAILQHGVVDFFLIPGVRFGGWLATAMFVGIWVWVVKDLRKYVYHEHGAKIIS